MSFNFNYFFTIDRDPSRGGLFLEESMGCPPSIIQEIKQNCFELCSDKGHRCMAVYPLDVQADLFVLCMGVYLEHGNARDQRPHEIVRGLVLSGHQLVSFIKNNTGRASRFFFPEGVNPNALEDWQPVELAESDVCENKCKMKIDIELFAKLAAVLPNVRSSGKKFQLLVPDDKKEICFDLFILLLSSVKKLDRLPFMVVNGECASSDAQIIIADKIIYATAYKGYIKKKIGEFAELEFDDSDDESEQQDDQFENIQQVSQAFIKGGNKAGKTCREKLKFCIADLKTNRPEAFGMYQQYLRLMLAEEIGGLRSSYKGWEKRFVELAFVAFEQEFESEEYTEQICMAPKGYDFNAIKVFLQELSGSHAEYRKLVCAAEEILIRMCFGTTFSKRKHKKNFLCRIIEFLIEST